MKKKLDCSNCNGMCCRYVVIDLNYEPRSERSFDEILWFLFHRKVQILKEGRNWSVLFLTDCSYLDANNRCKIYEQRPAACRNYPPTYDPECHKENFKKFSGMIFSSAEELLSYLFQKRKYAWAKDRMNNI